MTDYIKTTIETNIQILDGNVHRKQNRKHKSFLSFFFFTLAEYLWQRKNMEKTFNFHSFFRCRRFWASAKMKKMDGGALLFSHSWCIIPSRPGNLAKNTDKLFLLYFSYNLLCTLLNPTAKSDWPRRAKPPPPQPLPWGLSLIHI